MFFEVLCRPIVGVDSVRNGSVLSFRAFLNLYPAPSRQGCRLCGQCEVLWLIILPHLHAVISDRFDDMTLMMPLISMSPKTQLRKVRFGLFRFLSVTIRRNMGFGGLEGPSPVLGVGGPLSLILALQPQYYHATVSVNTFHASFRSASRHHRRVRVNSRRFPSFVANSISARCNTAFLFFVSFDAKSVELDIRSFGNKKREKEKKERAQRKQRRETMQERRATHSTGTRAVYAIIYLKDATTNAEAPSY